MNYRENYENGIKILKDISKDEAVLESRLLLEHVCGTDSNTLFAHPDREVSSDEETRFTELLRERATGRPIQYILGSWDFMGLEFNVNPSTLIPRQDTETLVEEVMKYLKDGSEILDMCTGSGCILLSLLHYSNECRGVGADINPRAVSLARENAAKLGIEAEFVESDMFESISGKFDFIVSNPPYIESATIETLDCKVKEFEPVAALDGGEDGLVFYRILCNECGKYLKVGGMVFFEIGYNQGESVKNLLQDAGFRDIRIVSDLAGLPRVAIATAP
ncbi:MAG: peptide chain release factor N(5)-glutamine methyltransferase [Lachnospiraceae bacterium]|nr:peptide chain release factor N(5)-glutamine methyltransferase [Lachnospiraceae bacterium]